MQFRRSEHISIGVPRERFEAAVAFYKSTFDLIEVRRDPQMVRLDGDNFTIWVKTEAAGQVLQEWVAAEPERAKAHLVGQGCTIRGESPVGFYVDDPFGLRFHVYTRRDEFHEQMFEE